MNLSRYWLLGILLLGLAGCNGSSTPVGKTAAELIESGNKDLAGGHLEEAWPTSERRGGAIRFGAGPRTPCRGIPAHEEVRSGT